MLLHTPFHVHETRFYKNALEWQKFNYTFIIMPSLICHKEGLGWISTRVKGGGGGIVRLKRGYVS